MLLQKENECFTLTFHCSNVQNNEHPKASETTRNKEKKKKSCQPTFIEYTFTFAN